MIASPSPRTELDRRRLYNDGAWVGPSGAEYRDVWEAATGELLGTAALGSAPDLDAAVRAARRALDEGPWGERPLLGVRR